MSTSSTPSSTAQGENPIPPRGPEDPTKIYSGGCHCGKFTFECRHPVLEDGFEAVSCNCSICTQRGYLVMYIMDGAKDFTLTKGSLEDLTRYKFNTEVVSHAFCPVCGCGLFAEVKSIIAVNLRAVKDLDLDSLTLKKYNGRAR